jgi:tRNA-specific 2-thiouridylase
MSSTKKRVLLGMSGGVDSSVAGYLLRRQGYDVVGVTMKVWPQDCISRAEDKCCGPQAVADARGVAHSLGIPHYVVDEADQFERLVIDYFSSEYQAGRTPNPCVMCNEKLKFGNLWNKAEALGCAFIATGHYAIIEHHPEHAVLRKGVDPRKDQSYFMFSLRQPQLRRALTPLGGMSKPAIREIARSLGLKVADKADSQEICFVPGNDYKAFLRSHLGQEEFHPGGIYDLEGNFLGEHEGIEMFTIGQRKGLPGGSAQPRYVVDLDPETNRVIVGSAEDLVSDDFEVDQVNWMLPRDSDEPLEVTVKIRYSHPGTGATVTPLENGRARIQLHEPQKAVTPGQAAVIYDGDVVVGGGWICRAAALQLV